MSSVTRPRRRRLRLVVGAVITFALAAFAFRTVDFVMLAKVLRGGDLRFVAAAGFVAVTFCIMAANMRLWVLTIALPTDRKPVTLAAHTTIYYASCAAHQLVPGPSAEVLRVVQLHRRFGYRVGNLVAAHIVERLIDGLTMAFIALGLSACVGLPDVVHKGVLIFTVAVGIGLCLGVTLAYFGPSRAGFLGRMSAAIRLLHSPRLWILGVGYSAIDSVAHALTVVLVGRALGIAVGTPAAFAAMMAARFASLAPALPGQFGVTEAGVVTVMVAFGVAASPALALALVFHVVHLVPITVVGLWQLQRLRLRYAGEHRDAMAPPHS